MCVPIEWIPVARRGKHSTVKHLHSCSNEKQILKKVEKMPILLFQTSGSQLFSHHGSLIGLDPKAGLSWGWLMKLRGRSLGGRMKPLGRGVSPAWKGTPITKSMRAYLWLNGAPCTRSTRFSQLKVPEKFPCSPRFLGFPHRPVGKESACNAGDSVSIPGSGRSPGEGIGYPLQYSWASLVALFSSVAQSCPSPCNPIDCSTPGLPVHHQLSEFIQIMSMESVMPSNHLILCLPLLLLPSIFPSIRVFSNESTLCMRWPKYWSFSFRISPSNEHSGLISFQMDWLDLLAVQETLKSLLQHRSSKASILRSVSHSVVPDSLGPHELYSLPAFSVHGFLQARILE